MEKYLHKNIKPGKRSDKNNNHNSVNKSRRGSPWSPQAVGEHEKALAGTKEKHALLWSEDAGGLELLSELVQHFRRDCGRVRAQQVLECFRPLPLVIVPSQSKKTQTPQRATETGGSTFTFTCGVAHTPRPGKEHEPKRSEATFFVCALDDSEVVFRNSKRCRWLFDEESVVSITGRVRLRLEQGVEVPEGRFHKLVCGHFLETTSYRAAQQDRHEPKPNNADTSTHAHTHTHTR